MIEVYYKRRRYRSMKDLADRLGVHTSQVSRACRHGYMLRGGYVIPVANLLGEGKVVR